MVKMQTAVGWHVELEFEEDHHRTRAAALLRLPDGNEVRAHGYASRHPADSDQPRVGVTPSGRLIYLPTDESSKLSDEQKAEILIRHFRSGGRGRG